MFVTLFGMVMEVRLKQFSNMPDSMLLILPGRVIDESFEQPEYLQLTVCQLVLAKTVEK